MAGWFGGAEAAAGVALFRPRPAMVWVCLLMVGLLKPVQAGWGLPALMETLADVHSASANFTERKTMQMLNAPLIASGTLRYVAPDYVAKTTVSPAPESFVLDHGTVTIGDDAAQERFDVAAQPQIGGLVEAVRATLAGDLPALRRFYDVRLTGGAADWRLSLRPKDAALAHFVRWIIIEGGGDRISAVDTVSGNGDHSEMGVSEFAVVAK